MSRRSSFSIAQLVLGFIGTGIAGTLYYAHRSEISLPCSSNGGCDIIAASSWAYLLGVPVSLIGAIGYIALTLMAIVKLNATGERAARSLAWLMLLISLGGTAFSWYLQYVAHVYIGAFCIYCRASAITMTLLFLTTLAECATMRRPENQPAESPSMTTPA